MWGKKREKEGTADQQLSKRDIREIQKKNVDEIEKVGVSVCDENRVLEEVEYEPIFVATGVGMRSLQYCTCTIFQSSCDGVFAVLASLRAWRRDIPPARRML